MRPEMHFISQCQTRAPAASISEIAGYPDGVDTSVDRSAQNRNQVMAPYTGGVGAIEVRAKIRIGVEGVVDSRRRRVRRTPRRSAGGHS